MQHHEQNSTTLAQERTLLASERTFSAWLRTALAAMAGGIAILKLIVFRSDVHKIVAHIAGVTLILWGCLLIVLASIDYKKISDALPRSYHYKNTRLGFILLVAPLLTIASLIIWVMVL
jgi:putative membrane protein